MLYYVIETIFINEKRATKYDSFSFLGKLHNKSNYIN